MYLFSTSASSQCQQIPNLGYFGYAYGQLKLSDNSFFMNGYHPSSPYPLHMYKLTFGQTSPDWNLSMLWSIGTWSLGLSESLLISSSIYTFFPYGSVKYLYMAVISLSDGSVSNRYKSSIACDYLSGSGVNGDYIVASIYWSSSYLLMFNRATNAFTIKSFSGTYLYGVALETPTNR